MTTATTADEFAGRLMGSALAGIDLLTVYLGERLGYYAALREQGAMAAPQLAAATGTSGRYAREWLEQQAVSAILTVDDDDAAPDARRYSVPEGVAEVLTEPLNLAYLAPMVRQFIATFVQAPALLRAFQSGGGVEWADYGPDMVVAQGDMNRPFHEHLFVQEYLSRLPDLHDRLSREGARVAEVGCGFGWGSIAVARGYPGASVDGFDLDLPSIEGARENARASAIGDRVHFHARDAGDPALAGSYDLVFAFECLHDMANPVPALAAMRRLARPGGTVLVVDERVADRFTAPGDDMERLMYGFSIGVCLPAAMTESPSAATGAVMRLPTLEGYARDAGFSRVEVLPLEHGQFRFYRLS